MKLPFGKKKSRAVAAIEGEIAALEKRRAELHGRLDAANNALELARIDRRNSIINGDDADATSVQKIDAIMSAGERDVLGLRDVLDEIETRLTASRQQLEFAKDDDERERRAAAMARAADDITKKSTALEAATDALAIALADFVTSVPDDVGLVVDHNGFKPNSAATPSELAAAIIGNGLLMSAPDIFETRKPHTRILRGAGVEKALVVRVLDAGGRLSNFLPGHHGEETEVLPTRLAAQQILVDTLREKARALRGSADVREAAE